MPNIQTIQNNRVSMVSKTYQSWLDAYLGHVSKTTTFNWYGQSERNVF